MRQFAFFWIFLFFTFCLEAQISSKEIDGSFAFSEKAKEFSLGWEAGINRSFLKDQTKFKLSKVNSYKAGLFIKYPFNASWNVQADLVYEKKGTYSEGLEVTYGFKYLSLAVYQM